MSQKKDKRITELERAVGAALYHIDHEDASLSGDDVKHMLKARQRLVDVMEGSTRPDAEGTEVMSQDKGNSTFSEVSEYDPDKTQQLKDELLRIRALAQDYVAAEQRLRKAREEDSATEWHEALEDVLDARSALVPHIFPRAEDGQDA